MEVWERAVRELGSMPVLLWLALLDKKHLEIKKSVLFVAAAVLLAAGSAGDAMLPSRLGGGALGVLLLFFCRFSKEAMGMADGILILVCGVAFGLYETAALCFFAALYAGIFSAILLITHKAGRKSRIPFLPFLLLGYVTMALILHTA